MVVGRHGTSVSAYSAPTAVLLDSVLSSHLMEGERIPLDLARGTRHGSDGDGRGRVNRILAHAAHRQAVY